MVSQVDVAKVLMLAGADAHARDHRSRCPLHMAALSGSEELVQALLSYGADPNKASDLGTTALHNAVRLSLKGVTVGRHRHVFKRTSCRMSHVASMVLFRSLFGCYQFTSTIV